MNCIQAHLYSASRRCMFSMACTALRHSIINAAQLWPKRRVAQQQEVHILHSQATEGLCKLRTSTCLSDCCKVHEGACCFQAMSFAATRKHFRTEKAACRLLIPVGSTCLQQRRLSNASAYLDAKASACAFGTGPCEHKVLLSGMQCSAATLTRPSEMRPALQL